MISRVPPPPALAVLFSAAVLLASALSIPAGPAHAFTSGSSIPTNPATRCHNDYNTSSASQTCSNETFTAVDNGRCRIDYTCAKADGTQRTGTTTIDTDDASSLNNCDGWLKTTSCN